MSYWRATLRIIFSAECSSDQSLCAGISSSPLIFGRTTLRISLPGDCSSDKRLCARSSPLLSILSLRSLFCLARCAFPALVAVAIFVAFFPFPPNLATTLPIYCRHRYVAPFVPSFFLAFANQIVARRYRQTIPTDRQSSANFDIPGTARGQRHLNRHFR